MKKRTKERCRILSRREPSKLEWRNAVVGCQSSYIAAEADNELQNPHEYPEYGGICWRQAYDEMIALRLLLDAAKLWDWASLYMGYLPKPQKDAIFASYVAAKDAYGLAWQMMEDCLVGQVA